MTKLTKTLIVVGIIVFTVGSVVSCVSGTYNGMVGARYGAVGAGTECLSAQVRLDSESCFDGERLCKA